jgi:hypothetical protein
MGLQSPGSPIWRDFELPLGSPGKNSHLDVASVESCRVYYKGEGGGFPQFRAVVSVSVLPVVRPNTKCALTLH